MRKNSIKNTRINMEVQRELSELIRSGIKDPRIHPMTSVVAVEVTPDLKYCKAYVSVLGDEEAGKAFWGEAPELAGNPNWRGVQISRSAGEGTSEDADH